jgi:SAM-dependent methyltransferase
MNYKKRAFGTEHLDYYNYVSEFKYIDKYLDIGCADFSGTNTVPARNRFGIDIYKSNEATIVKNLNKDKIPFKNNTFDVISSFEVIEHIENTDFFINEIHRTLKNDGCLFISTPNLSWWTNRLLLLFGWQPANTEVDNKHSMFGKPKIFKDEVGSGHIHVFTDKAMTEFLGCHKFKIIDKIPDHSHYTGWLKMFSILDSLISKIPGFARGYIYICKKQ